jgi:hypothetical protein
MCAQEVQRHAGEFKIAANKAEEEARNDVRISQVQLTDGLSLCCLPT